MLREAWGLPGARTQLERALAIARPPWAPTTRIGHRHNNLGLVLRDLGDLAGARTQHERALEIAEATLGPDHPDMAIWHSNLGLVLRDLGDLAGARTQHERALEIAEATLGPDHPTWPPSAATSTMSCSSLAVSSADASASVVAGGQVSFGDVEQCDHAGHQSR